jgi:FAS-associated factor 2
MPFHLLYKFISGTFSLFGYLFPFLPRLFASRSAQARRNTTGRRLLNPKDTATRFKREFEEQYGPNELPLFENGYAQALDLAKKDFKFLLVVLLSPEHDDAAAYVRDTLLSPEVIAFVKNPSNNIILWIGNVQDSEAYQVSTALNCTKFPFAALISHTSETGPTAMSVILRLTGLMAPSAWVANMQQTMEQYSAQLADARAARAAQHAERSIRQEQDSAYERSLARDRERARQRREEEAARARALQEAQEAALAAERYVASLEKWRRWRAQHIAPEPGPEVKDSVRIAIRLKHERVTRRFKADTPLEELYAFVECYDMLQEEEVATQHGDIPEPEGFDHEYKFQLVSPMPRIIYSVADGGTILDKVGRSGNLIVEYIDGDEDEE